MSGEISKNCLIAGSSGLLEKLLNLMIKTKVKSLVAESMLLNKCFCVWLFLKILVCTWSQSDWLKGWEIQPQRLKKKKSGFSNSQKRIGEIYLNLTRCLGVIYM